MNTTGAPSRRRILAFGLLWLAWIWALALVSENRLPWPDNPWTYDLERRMSPLARWDSGWYVPLAEAGYGRPPRHVGDQTNHAFFPLYPGLMRLVARTTGLETSLAGNLISAVSLLGALVLLADWVGRRWGDARIAPALAVFLLFPTSFFFATVYTEALVLLLSLAAVLAAETDRPAVSFVFGLLAGLTRISGLVLAPFLFLVALRGARARGRRGLPPLLRSACAGLSPLAGFGLFCLYFHRRFGDALLFVNAQHNWAQEEKTVWQGPGIIWRTITRDLATGHAWQDPGRTFEGLYLVLFAGLALLLFVRRRFPEALYVSLVTGIVLASGTLESSGRYVLPAFPGFAVLAGLRRFRLAWPIWLVASLVAQAVYVFLFVNFIWAG